MTTMDENEFRATDDQLENIESEQELMGLLAHADLIASCNESTGDVVTLWERPAEEIAARGLPLTIGVLGVYVAGGRGDALLRAAVGRLKGGE